jgi:hypothetical protein
MPLSIPLRNSLLYVLVDDADYPLVSQYHWTRHRTGYAVAYPSALNPNPLPLYMHRLLMDDPQKLLVDHIDGDKLNNRRDNLRLVSASENVWNSRPRNGKQFKGVSQRYGKSHARITVQGKSVSLGFYATAAEAARVYDGAVRRLGVPGYLNFPDCLTSADIEALLDRCLNKPLTLRVRKPRPQPQLTAKLERVPGGWLACLVRKGETEVLSLHRTRRGAESACERALQRRQQD